MHPVSVSPAKGHELASMSSVHLCNLRSLYELVSNNQLESYLSQSQAISHILHEYLKRFRLAGLSWSSLRG
jgi:hypothetical protein